MPYKDPNDPRAVAIRKRWMDRNRDRVNAKRNEERSRIREENLRANPPVPPDPNRPIDYMAIGTPLEVSPYFALLKEKQLFSLDPIGIIKGGFLKIKTDDGELVPFVLNEVQLRVVNKIQELRRAKRPVRLAVLKARQTGISTLFEAIVFCWTTQKAYTNALILSHKKEHANYLLKMCQLFYDNFDVDEHHLCPKKKHSTEFKFEFQHKRSMMMIETAKNLQAGRGTTLRCVHASECAFYPDFELLMKALGPAVPDKKDTLFLLETTANGTNQFYKFWNHIRAQEKRGATDWVTIFIPWCDFKGYARPFSSPLERDRFSSSLSREERDLALEYKLTLEQLHWRRLTLETKYLGDDKQFKVEYPICPEEAFQSTSKTVFPQSLLKSQEKNIMPPKMVGEMEWDGKKSFFIPSDRGDLQIFKTVMPEHRYVIAADCGQGATTHDPSCAQVIDRTTWEQVAVYHSNTDPDLYAKALFALGAYYNWAQVAPEINGPGVAVISYLRDLNYPNIYHRQKMQVTDNGAWVETEELGWQTNVKNKPLIITGMVDVLRSLLIILRDRDTLEELQTFVVKEVREEGYIKYGAEEGCYDDRAMALMIAIHLAKQLPSERPTIQEAPRFHITRSTGYG